MTADFHRLNVLLMRGIDRDGEVVAKKVATATLTGAHIRATLGEKNLKDSENILR